MRSEKLIIEGGERLSGEIKIGSAKNAVLKLMAASIMSNDVCVINNIPHLTDVYTMLSVLKELGIKVDLNHDTAIIDSRSISTYTTTYDLVKKIRASFVVLGALLARCGKAKVALPGGCAIGERRINLHVKGLEALGAEVKIENGYVIAQATRLKGSKIYLDRPSVGATENIMIAATIAEGSTIISNAAQEPEIIDLANFINAMGGEVIGAGTPEIIVVGTRQKDLHGIQYSPIPDRIEAGTYLSIAAITKSDLVIQNVISMHLSAAISKLTEMGALISVKDSSSIKISMKQDIQPIELVTLPYPGFPTDLQAPIMAVLSIAKGTSIITENIYENRFMHVGELRRMGADVQQEGSNAIIKGVPKLTGAQVEASDLRAAAALVTAGLGAEGITEVTNLEHLDRGYEFLVEKLTNVGAKIKRVPHEETVVNQEEVILK